MNYLQKEQNLLFQGKEFRKKGYNTAIISGASGSFAHLTLIKLGFSIIKVKSLHSYRVIKDYKDEEWYEDASEFEENVSLNTDRFVFVDDHIDTGLTLNFIQRLLDKIEISGIILYDIDKEGECSGPQDWVKEDLWQYCLRRIPKSIEIFDGRKGIGDYRTNESYDKIYIQERSSWIRNGRSYIGGAGTEK